MGEVRLGFHLTSPIFMLKFLIIWSAAISGDNFHVIRSTFILHE